MAINDIDLGTAPDNKTGDELRTGGQKINANFDYLNQVKLEEADILGKLDKSTYTGTAADLKALIDSNTDNFQYYILLSDKGQPLGVASLGSDGKIDPSQIGNLAITDIIEPVETDLETFVANSANYTFEKGDVIIITDVNGDNSHYMYKGGIKTDVVQYSLINAKKIAISQVQGLQAALDEFSTENINKVININTDDLPVVNDFEIANYINNMPKFTIGKNDILWINVTSPYVEITGNAINSYNFSLTFQEDITVDWGDGTIETVTGDGTNKDFAHTYQSPFSGKIKLSGALDKVDKFFSNNDSNVQSSIEMLAKFSNLKEFEVYGEQDWGGNIANLPSSLRVFSDRSASTAFGDITNLPSGLTELRLTGSNTISGSISNLPIGLTVFEVTGSNTTTGDIGTLPAGLTRYYNIGQNTTFGDIGTLPIGVTYYLNFGNNTTTGDIGNLPSGLTYYNNRGNNTTTGDIGTLPSGLVTFINGGANTTFGDIGSLPIGLTYFDNGGFNTTTGDIANLPPGLAYYNNDGDNTVQDYSTGRTWNTQIDTFISLPTNVGLSSSEVDSLLIDLSNLDWAGKKQIDIRRGNAARTTASDAAVSTLVSKGVNVLTN